MVEKYDLGGSKPALLQQIESELNRAAYKYTTYDKSIDLAQIFVPQVYLGQDLLTPRFTQELGLNRLKLIFLSAPKQEPQGNSVGVVVKVDSLTGNHWWSKNEPCLGLSLAGIDSRYNVPLNLPLPERRLDSLWYVEGWRINGHHLVQTDDEWIKYGQELIGGREYILALIADSWNPTWTVYLTSVWLPGGWQELVKNGRFIGCEGSDVSNSSCDNQNSRVVIDLSKKPVESTIVKPRITSTKPWEDYYLPEGKRRELQRWEKELWTGTTGDRSKRPPEHWSDNIDYSIRASQSSKYLDSTSSEQEYRLRSGITVVVRQASNQPDKLTANGNEEPGKKWWEETGIGKMSIRRKARQNKKNHKGGKGVRVKSRPKERADSKRG